MKSLAERMRDAGVKLVPDGDSLHVQGTSLLRDNAAIFADLKAQRDDLLYLYRERLAIMTVDGISEPEAQRQAVKDVLRHLDGIRELHKSNFPPDGGHTNGGHTK